VKGTRLAAAVIGLGLLGSQAGHLVAYQLLFGGTAQHVQSTGVHAYFPVVAKTAVGAGAAVLLGGMLLVGLARVLNGRQGRSDTQTSFIGLLAVLFTLQLAMFAAQEIGEAVVAGSRVATAPQLLLWGTLGQLPVAAVAALALHWLSLRVETAVGVIKDLVRVAVSLPPAGPMVIPVYAASERVLLAFRVAPSDLAKRGPPPSSSRISTY
jgi:hypothetical protein